jgi:hypothetical protein
MGEEPLRDRGPNWGCYFQPHTQGRASVQRESSSDPSRSSPTPQRFSLDQLAEAVSVDTGIPPGRVLRILISAERLKALMEQGAEGSLPPGVATSATPTQHASTNDPVRWYPVGANGRLRAPLPPGMES